MSDSNIFKALMQGREDAAEYERGEIDLVTHVYEQQDVQAIRTAAGLSQSECARLIGVSVRTLQHWEQGHRQPTGPARALLTIVETRPESLAALREEQPAPACYTAPALPGRQRHPVESSFTRTGNAATWPFPAARRWRRSWSPCRR